MSFALSSSPRHGRLAALAAALLLLSLPSLLPAAADFHSLEDDRVIPLGALAPGTNSVQLVGDEYLLNFQGDETIEYRIDRTHADLLAGVIRVAEASSGAVVMRGGQRFKNGTNEGFGSNVWWALQVPANTAETFLSNSIVNNEVLLDYQHVYLGVTHQVRYAIGIRGKSLYIHTYSLTPGNTLYSNNYSGFDLGSQEGMTGSRFLRVPFMEHVPVTFFGGSWFFSSFVDMNVSSAANRSYLESGQGNATNQNYMVAYYNKMTDGTINAPVDDLVWATISSKIEDVFPDTENYPVSPHRNSANKTAVVRQAGPNAQPVIQGTWANTLAQIQKLFNAGFHNSEQYLWNWQYYFINVNEPTNYPPRAGMGSTAQYNALIQYANDVKNPFGLYYTIELMDQGYSSACWVFNGEGGANPSYDPVYVNKNAAGGFMGGWDTSNPLNTALICNAAIGHPTRVLSLNHQPFHLLREYKLMQENYLPQTLSYIDARHTLPSNQTMDHEAGTDKIHNIRDGLMASKTLFMLQKSMTGGPLLGEGTQFRNNKADLELSGYSDGIRLYMIPPSGNGASWLLLPDYILRVIRPKTLHHGMGVEPEFTDFNSYLANQDAVRCAQIVNGQGIYVLTNGDVPNDFLQDPDEIRAYYQVTADLQPQFGAAGLLDIGYFDGASFLDLKQAVVANYNFVNSQLRIRYDNGLEIYANGAASGWSRTVAGVNFTLPQDGWVAYNPNTGYLNFSAIPSGYAQRFDYVLAPGKYEMIDGRGTVTAYGGISARNLRVQWSNGRVVAETGTFPSDFTITGPPPPRDMPDPPDLLPLPPPFDASVDFRQLQGMYGWLYRAYDPALAVPADRPYWAKFHHYPELDYNAAANAYSYRNNPAVNLGPTLMIPGNNVGCVRGWVAFQKGVIRVDGQPHKRTGSLNGNGVRVRIRDNFEGTILWENTLVPGDTAGMAHSLSLNAHPGDLLLFEVDPMGDATNDTVVWGPVITYTSTTSAGGWRGYR